MAGPVRLLGGNRPDLAAKSGRATHSALASIPFLPPIHHLLQVYRPSSSHGGRKMLALIPGLATGGGSSGSSTGSGSNKTGTATTGGSTGSSSGGKNATEDLILLTTVAYGDSVVACKVKEGVRPVYWGCALKAARARALLTPAGLPHTCVASVHWQPGFCSPLRMPTCCAGVGL